MVSGRTFLGEYLMVRISLGKSGLQLLTTITLKLIYLRFNNQVINKSKNNEVQNKQL